jgi:hypothetical protein
MKEKIKKLVEKLEINKENYKVFIIFIAFVIGSVLLVSFFPTLGTVFFIISFSVLCLITWFMASVVIFRSLFVIGGGLSLMIFIAKTYCDLPLSQHTADSSLQTLFYFGIMYLVWLFFNSLYKELLGDKETESKGSLKKIEEIYDGKKPLLIVIPYAIFIGLFLYQLYTVMNPIIHSLCIYK